MPRESERDTDATYSLGPVVRLTGLSAHTIRAWERRYGAVRPARTPGGTRRYGEEDVARLRLLRAGVEAGHRISQLASLPDEAIEKRLAADRPPPARPLEEIHAAIERLDAREIDRVLAMQFSVLGASAFAREIASPLLQEVGDRWERGQLSVAAEHLVSAAIRGILGLALSSASQRTEAPRVLFATPAGERHEFGLLIAAVTAVGAGAQVTYLGPDLPVDELARAVGQIGPAAVGLSVIHLAQGPARHYVAALRRSLPEEVEIWVGGPARADDAPGVVLIEDLEDLERRVRRLLRLSVLV